MLQAFLAAVWNLLHDSCTSRMDTASLPFLLLYLILCYSNPSLTFFIYSLTGCEEERDRHDHPYRDIFEAQTSGHEVRTLGRPHELPQGTDERLQARRQ